MSAQPGPDLKSAADRLRQTARGTAALDLGLDAAEGPRLQQARQTLETTVQASIAPALMQLRGELDKMSSQLGDELRRAIRSEFEGRKSGVASGVDLANMTRAIEEHVKIDSELIADAVVRRLDSRGTLGAMFWLLVLILALVSFGLGAYFAEPVTGWLEQQGLLETMRGWVGLSG